MFLKTPITMIATYFGRIKTPIRRTGNKSSNTVPIGRRTYKANKKRAKQIVSRYTISCTDFTRESHCITNLQNEVFPQQQTKLSKTISHGRKKTKN